MVERRRVVNLCVPRTTGFFDHVSYCKLSHTWEKDACRVLVVKPEDDKPLRLAEA